MWLIRRRGAVRPTLMGPLIQAMRVWMETSGDARAWERFTVWSDHLMRRSRPRGRATMPASVSSTFSVADSKLTEWVIITLTVRTTYLAQAPRRSSSLLVIASSSHITRSRERQSWLMERLKWLNQPTLDHKEAPPAIHLPSLGTSTPLAIHIRTRLSDLSSSASQATQLQLIKWGSRWARRSSTLSASSSSRPRSLNSERPSNTKRPTTNSTIVKLQL